MRISEDKLQRIISDLGINTPYFRGQDITVHNCWHFYTDGRSVDCIYYDEEDFRNGMNRVFVTVQNYDVVILAFVLMDTHIHFILHGTFDQCNKFIHEYIRRTSIYISNKYSIRKYFKRLPASHQPIDTDRYLKSAICYVIKNPTVGGLPSMYYDYPWSSGSLYFRSRTSWTSPCWATDYTETGQVLSKARWKVQMKTRSSEGIDSRLIDGIIFPGEYVAYEIVERLFRTAKSFLYFIGSTKDTDIESRGGVISGLSLPDQEMRQHKNELCMELFGVNDSHHLDTGKRIHLARKLRSVYNSSPKQIARICGLKFEEVKDLL